MFGSLAVQILPKPALLCGKGIHCNCEIGIGVEASFIGPLIAMTQLIHNVIAPYS